MASKRRPGKSKTKSKRPRAKRKPTTSAKANDETLSQQIDRVLAAAEVDGVVKRLDSPVQRVVDELRRLMRESAPEAIERLDEGSPAYFANGLFARIEPGDRKVMLRLFNATELPTAQAMDSASEDAGDVGDSLLRKLVREAVLMNLAK